MSSIFLLAVLASFRKFNPLTLMRNPVIFITEIGALITTVDYLLIGGSFILQISLWLWFTVLFANFAEGIAEERGKAHANALRKMRTEVTAHRVRGEATEDVAANLLEKGDVILVKEGEIVPADGEIVQGAASIDESMITGESAPVIREAGGDRTSVTGGTKVLSDAIHVRVTRGHGESFLDHIIQLVEGAHRKKTPNEIALTLLLSALTLIFLGAVVTLKFFGLYANVTMGITALVALLVCLIPTTIGGLLSAISIASIYRMVKAKIIALSGKAVETAGNIDVLLLDKTGTITLGNRQATAFIPLPGVKEEQLAEAALLASLSDETPEGKSIVELGKKRHKLTERELKGARFIPFTAQSRLSGVDVNGHKIRKGAFDAIERFVTEEGGSFPSATATLVEEVARRGATPLVVADHSTVLGVVELCDVLKNGIKERLSQLKHMGIRSIMVTGDHPLTAAAVAKEAGLDGFLAEETPEAKLRLIQEEQAAGHLVAMTGDGTNDAPALAQADVGVAMNSGTQAAKEAANIVDLDSDPAKIIEIVKLGKQMLMTRGSLTTFSIANDVAKYFAILPAMLSGVFPMISPLNIMALRSPESAILSAVIFNALIIVALIPLALKGVALRHLRPHKLLRRNLLIYGLGGIIAPFVGIKLIDLMLMLL